MNMKKYLGPALMGMALFSTILIPVLAAGPGAVDPAQKDARQIAEKVIPSVVRVEVQNHVRRVATGVILDREGNIVTTALTYPRGGKILVSVFDGEKVEAEFIGFDTETQLAVVRAKKKNLVPINAGRAGDLAPGSWVCAVGVSPENTPSITQGIVSSHTGNKLRLNIWVTPGSSGGPVVNEDGRMVGLLRGIYTEERPLVYSFRDREQTGVGYVLSQAEAPSSGMALAVPVDLVMHVVSEIKEKGKVERGWLGVGVAMNEDGKVIVTEVDKESPAEMAKVQENDIILSVNKKEISSTDELASEIRNSKPGQQIVLAIDRDGKKSEIKVKLGEYTEADARRELEVKFPRLFRFSTPAPEKVTPVPKPVIPTFGKRRYIGVYCDELTTELAGHFGVKDGRGLIVSKLTEDGPALKAGMKVGDVVVKVDGKRIETLNQLIDVLQEKQKGDKATVELLRDKKMVTLEVEIGEEDIGGSIFGAEDFRNYLDRFRDYSSRLGKETAKWRDEYSLALKENMKKIDEELTKKSEEAREQIKKLVVRIGGSRKV